MTAQRDRQRQRVYDWEDRVVAPCAPGHIPFPAAQGMVNAIWSEMGLRYPPLVEPLPAQSRRCLAHATRLAIRLPSSTPSWCLLHELAHAMTTTHDGQSDGHGPVFVGIYVQLLSRYLRPNQAWLLWTLKEAGVELHLRARPVILGA